MKIPVMQMLDDGKISKFEFFDAWIITGRNDKGEIHLGTEGRSFLTYSYVVW